MFFAILTSGLLQLFGSGAAQISKIDAVYDVLHTHAMNFINLMPSCCERAELYSDPVGPLKWNQRKSN